MNLVKSKFWNNISFVIKLYKLRRIRLESLKNYQAFQSYQADRIYSDLKRIFNISSNSYFVDWGCGEGGFTKFFARKFINILGVDSNVPKNIKNIKFLKRDLRSYVLDKKADIIFCSSFIEHVDDHKLFISQVSKSLKKDGFLCLSFPPFYSLPGGHYLKPFHYLPEKLAILITKRLNILPPYVTSFKNLWGNWGLTKTTIKEIKQILVNNGLEIKVCKARFTNENSFYNVAKIPVLNEFLTWHVEFYCVKK